MAQGMMQAELTGVAPPFVRHGGRLDEAIHAFPGAPRPWIDLSTGINPHAWHPPADLRVDPGPLPAIAALRGMEDAAARYFGVDGRYVAAVPGSELALRLLPTLGLPAPIVAMHPCYGTHAAVALRTLSRDRVDTIGAGTLLIANPNNPDGRVTGHDHLQHLMQAQQTQDGWLVIDEAFADANPDTSVVSHCNKSTRSIILRSFGKFFGLAGIRLGFVVAPEDVISRVRFLLGDWPVSAQAIAWGRAAYADDDWIATTRTRLTQAATRLDGLLARHGLTALGESPLFRLVEHPAATTIFERLARAGILTRPFADRPDWLRFGLPADDAAFDRLERALSDG